MAGLRQLLLLLLRLLRGLGAIGGRGELQGRCLWAAWAGLSGAAFRSGSQRGCCCWVVGVSRRSRVQVRRRALVDLRDARVLGWDIFLALTSPNTRPRRASRSASRSSCSSSTLPRNASAAPAARVAVSRLRIRRPNAPATPDPTPTPPPQNPERTAHHSSLRPPTCRPGRHPPPRSPAGECQAPSEREK